MCGEDDMQERDRRRDRTAEITSGGKERFFVSRLSCPGRGVGRSKRLKRGEDEVENNGKE